MCKEDVRIGRQMDHSSSLSDLNAGDVVAKVLPPRPSRIAISMTGLFSPAALGDCVMLMATNGTTVRWLGAITPSNPTWHGDIREYGQQIVESWSVQNNGTNFCEVSITEHYLDTDLEDV